jgi:hypothetical protein
MVAKRDRDRRIGTERRARVRQELSQPDFERLRVMPRLPLSKDGFVRLGHGAKPVLEPVQPRALFTLNRKATEYTNWLTAHELTLQLEEPALTATLTHFCWHRGYTEIDIDDLRAFLVGSIVIGADETPPDPPDEKTDGLGFLSDIEDVTGDD